MITFNEINSFAYLSQETIFTLILSGVNLRQLQIDIAILVTKISNFGSDLFSKILILVYRYGRPNFEAQKTQICHLN